MVEPRRRIKQSLTQIPVKNGEVVGSMSNYYNSSVDSPSISKKMLKVLTEPHSFMKHSKSGKSTYCIVYFSEALNKLNIDKTYSNYILTTSISSIVPTFSNNSKMRIEEETKIYGFCVQTNLKTYEFSTDNMNLRDKFVEYSLILIKLCKEYMSAMGLKKYCESIINSRQNEEYIKSSKNRNREASSQEKDTLEKQVIQGLLNQLISKVELMKKQEDYNNLKFFVQNFTNKRTVLSHTQENLKNSIKLKDNEITSLKRNIKTIEQQIDKLRKPSYCQNSSVFSQKIWTLIIEHLNSKEITILRTVTRIFRAATNRVLAFKPTWRKLCLGTLSPREIMYRLYIRKFYNASIRGEVEISSELVREIHKDVEKGLNDNNRQIEEILVKLCSYNMDLKYCQEMNYVAQFLYEIFKDTEEVIRVMDSLLRPPFFLAELWKNDFSRLKLGIFQLDFLIKIRLPYVHKHLKNLEINLDTIVTPWFLTVFTYFCYEIELPKNNILEIWDFFLIQGWPALISACLSIFFLNQELILDKSYEQTMLVLKTKIPVKDLTKTIPKFEVDPKLLVDLEGSFTCSSFMQ